MSAHTAGSWLVNSFDNSQVIHSNGEHAYEPIARCAFGTVDERAANARLIAAAPDLLAALQLFNNDASLGHAASGVYTITVDGRDLIQMRAAIAKATGSAT